MVSPPWAASNTTRRPVAAIASAMPNSSAGSANVPGTGRPSRATWPSVRDVENPTAPASTASRTMRAIAAMSSSVAGSFEAPRSPIT